MSVVVMLWFSRMECHSKIFGHVFKVVTFVAFHFSAQIFKHVETSSLCFTRPSWIILLCMTFKVVYVPIVSFVIHNFMSKIITFIT
jgi:hypothetical protein